VLADIGLGVAARMDLTAISHAALVTLRDLTGETAHLGILRGATNVLFLDSVESERVVRTSSRVGRLLPAHSTATPPARPCSPSAPTRRSPPSTRPGCSRRPRPAR